MNKTIRLPEGASWVRFKNVPSNPWTYYQYSLGTYLLYHGVKWGGVRRYLAALDKSHRWLCEDNLGRVKWSKTKTGAQRLLVRTLQDELKQVQTMMAPKSPTLTPELRRYRKLSTRDLLRQGDEYADRSLGKWRPISKRIVGMHPYPHIEYRRPIKDVR